MSLLALKLVLTPCLIAAATLVARRWGPAVGGWLAGLPFTSGPVSVFLALEQGPGFAAVAAEGTLLGLIPVAAFCLAYSQVAGRASAWAALGLGLLAYLAVTGLVSLLSPGLWPTVIVVFLALLLAVWLLGTPAASRVPVAPPWWDLPLRMATATAMVLLLTGSAALIGPQWSGLLSPFPVFASVMAVFAQQAAGPAAAQRLLRGVVIGALAFAAFFLVVALSVAGGNLLFSYTLAALVALSLNGVSLVALVRERPV
ncbi:MAG: hypothetical protein L0332_09470 [Chloroflexi bacterium]|nr:hypothetical protein [Chloroflexota bacterium]MCI0579857.1 hypothetical protein [Chloroflexota bacterium]MCI0643257.1 hypothetical protein [Chloroflexota bacterium]MCI0726935.1 hypothetical protein [Chloroflexota bacterium]